MEGEREAVAGDVERRWVGSGRVWGRRAGEDAVGRQRADPTRAVEPDCELIVFVICRATTISGGRWRGSCGELSTHCRARGEDASSRLHHHG